MRTNECFMPGSGFLLASAARPTGVASRKGLLPTVLPPVGQGLGRGPAVDDIREDEGAAGDLVWSNVMMAIFTQSNGAAGHLRASERAAGDLDAVGRGAGDLGGVDRAIRGEWPEPEVRCDSEVNG